MTQQTYAARYRAKCIAEGRCPDCGKPKPADGPQACQECREKRRLRCQARYDKQRTGTGNGQWRGDAAQPHSKRRRAYKVYPLGQCERCDKPATDRHHRDTNTGNNAPENIERLCRRCHMQADGRLAAFVSRASDRPISAGKPCTNCGRLANPLRKGRCSACNWHYVRHGTERPSTLCREVIAGR